MPLGVARDEAVLTKEDIATIRALDKENREKRGVPLRVLRTPETFPDLYTFDPNDKTKCFVHPDGKKYRPLVYDEKDGKFVADQTRWFKRGKERWFEGSDRWPQGLVVGTTYVETQDVEGSRKYTFTGSQEDFCGEEKIQLKRLAELYAYHTTQEKVKIGEEKERRRAQQAEDALNPDALMTRTATAAAVAAVNAMQKPAPVPVPETSGAKK